MLSFDESFLLKLIKLFGVVFFIYCLIVSNAFAQSHDLEEPENFLVSQNESIKEVKDAKNDQTKENETDSSTDPKNESEKDELETVQSDKGTKITEPAPVEEEENSSGNTMMYIGIGVLAAGAVVLGLSGGGGSSSSSETTVTEPPVGPDLNGNNWSGTLNLVNYGSQSISATIVHSGSNVTIQTNSAFPYGKEFSGTISSSGYLTLWDADTGEEWTTHYHKASSSSIKIYDYVNDFKDLDELVLYR